MKVKTKDVTLNLPKQFQLVASTYKVNVDNQANDWNDSMGMFSDNMKEIKLATQVGYDILPSDSILDTYYHELAHALVYNTKKTDYYKDEEFIDLLGRFLRQYLESIKY